MATLGVKIMVESRTSALCQDECVSVLESGNWVVAKCGDAQSVFSVVECSGVQCSVVQCSVVQCSVVCAGKLQ